MHRQLVYIATVVMFGGIMLGQQKQSTSTHTTKATAPPPGAKTNLPSEETLNAFLQQTFGYEPQVSWKIESIRPAPAEGLAEVRVLLSNPQGQQEAKLYVTADGRHALLGDLIPFGARPFDDMRKQLGKEVTGPARGPAEAAVTIVEFSDLQCPHCKAAQPNIDKLLNEDKDARLVFQNFPLPSHDWAAKAAAYADCVSRSSSDAFWKFIEGTYGAQNDITAANADEKLTAIADKAGVKGSDMSACAAKPETVARVESSVALGKSVEVDSTPTMFINGRKVPGGVPYEVLKGLVDFAAKN